MSKILLLLFFVMSYGSYAFELNGFYKGAVTRDGSVQMVEINFTFENGVQKGKYFIPEMGLYDVAVRDITNSADTLFFTIAYGQFACFINKESGDITGLSVKWLPKLRIHLKKSKPNPENFLSEEITFKTADAVLQGTLYKPYVSSENIPYVVLVHGSGEQDRNTAYYRSLAYNLAQNGIGVLFYDKRGCGLSTTTKQDYNFYDLSADAGAAIDYLKSRNDLKISKTGLLGSSQGGWISAITANKTPGCDFVIFNVGPAVSLFEQDIHRVIYTMREENFKQAEIDSAAEYTRLYFRYTESNSEDDWKMLTVYSDKIKNNSWAEYVNIPAGKNDADILWWRANAYDPAQDITRLKCPVLSIFGEKDVLVPPLENQKKMDSLLRSAGIPYKIEVMEGCAHDLLTYQGLNGNDWNWPIVYWQWRKQPSEYSELLINWIKSL
jgi:uncharacterized protein